MRPVEIGSAVGVKTDGFVLRWDDGKIVTYLSRDFSGFVADLECAKVFRTFRDAHEARKGEESSSRILDVVALAAEEVANADGHVVARCVEPGCTCLDRAGVVYGSREEVPRGYQID